MEPKVGFICVHNSCSSQMAEALGKLFASDVFDSYSAGTETKPKINQDAMLSVLICLRSMRKIGGSCFSSR